MTKDEIIELAYKATESEIILGTLYEAIKVEYVNIFLISFAKLIAEKEREHLVQIGLIGVLKHCEDLLREDGHEDAMNDVQEMISKIRARGQE